MEVLTHASMLRCAGLKEVDKKMLEDHNVLKKEIEEELERQFPLKQPPPSKP